MANKMCLKMAAAGIPVTNTSVSTSGSISDKSSTHPLVEF